MHLPNLALLDEPKEPRAGERSATKEQSLLGFQRIRTTEKGYVLYIRILDGCVIAHLLEGSVLALG